METETSTLEVLLTKFSSRQSGASLRRLPVSAHADYYKNQVICTLRMVRCSDVFLVVWQVLSLVATYLMVC